MIYLYGLRMLLCYYIYVWLTYGLIPKVLHFPFCFHSKNNFFVLTGTSNMCAEFYTRIIIAGGNIIWKAILWSTRRGEKSTKEPCVISTFLRSAT